MEIVSRAAAAAIIGCVLALLLKKYSPELSLLTAIAAGLAVFSLSIGVCSRVTEILRSIAQNGGIASVYISPVVKCIGIGLVTNLAAQICRDAGQGSIASVTEMCGTFCALYIALPLMQSLLGVLQRLV